MGVVMLARDEHLERQVAIKVIRRDALEPGFARQFIEEARAMARVNHPNVLCIHAFGEHETLPYFVTEHVEGQTLEDWLAARKEPAPLPVALSILEAICQGVEAIHQAGTVHRDLKPSNILLDDGLRTRVADFGVSANRNGAPCEIAGTPAYMAPEVALSAGELDTPSPLSDVYSLGCIAFELLTGQRPFRAHNALGFIVHHVTEPVPLPTTLRPDLPRAFNDVLLRALAKPPRERTPSGRVFCEELRRAAGQDFDPVRIVVAEDDEDFRSLLAEGLCVAFPSAEIECVGDGTAALQSLARRPASVALIDLQMPVLDGVSVTAALRAQDAVAHMPIIVLTGLGGAGEWKCLADIGADGFLVKPFRMDDLVTLVRRSIRERTGASGRSPARPAASER
jgi:serine/threonine-protein kinase